MLWVHVPYSRHKNELIEVEQEIMAENGYDSSDYFNRYDGEKSYKIKNNMLFLMRKRNLLNLIVEMLLIDRYVLMLLKRDISILQMILK